MFFKLAIKIQSISSTLITMPQVIYKPHCHYQNFSPLANGVYLIAIINKTPLRNGNCPITGPLAEMGVAHTVGQYRPEKFHL